MGLQRPSRPFARIDLKGPKRKAPTACTVFTVFRRLGSPHGCLIDNVSSLGVDERIEADHLRRRSSAEGNFGS